MQTGKTSLALDSISTQLLFNGRCYCVYIAIGQKKASVAKINDFFFGSNSFYQSFALRRLLIISSSSSDSAVLQFLAPYTGCSVGEWLSKKGGYALVVYDDLSKQAIAYRQMSLLLRRPPGREAYPGDVGKYFTSPKRKKAVNFIVLNLSYRNMFIQKLGDELSQCKMIFIGDNLLNKFGYNTESILKRRIDCNKKSLSLFNATGFKKKHRRGLSLTLYGKRYFSDAFTVNVNSQKIQNKEHKMKLMLTLDSEYNNNKFKISNQVANLGTLHMALNQLEKKSGHISEERLIQISKEIKEGKYEFQPLFSYKLPKKSVELNKGMVQKYIKKFSVKEKLKFFKDMKEQKRHTRVITEDRYIFEESFENKVVAKAIQLVLNKIIEEKQFFPRNMFAYQNNKSAIDVIDYLKTKISKSKLTFMIKADLKNFFPSIQKNYLMKGLTELVDANDNKFYHLLKSYFRCGYIIKILSKSKHLAARNVKIIHKNKSKELVYQGSVLAPLFSNIINSLIIKKINNKIEESYTVGNK